MVQQITRKQVVAFRLAAVQDEVAGWWEAPISIFSLGLTRFPVTLWLPWDKGIVGDPEGRNPGNSQGFAVPCWQVGVPSGVLCSMLRDLQRCMEPIMWLKGNNILEASLLEVADYEPGVSPNQAEEATLLGKDPRPQEAWKTTTHPPDCPEETPEPRVVTRVADPQNVWQQMPPHLWGSDCPPRCLACLPWKMQSP